MEYQQACYNKGHIFAVFGMISGIFSIILAFVYGIGVIFAITGLVLCGKAADLGYVESTRRAGKVMSIIGLVISLLVLLLAMEMKACSSCL